MFFSYTTTLFENYHLNKYPLIFTDILVGSPYAQHSDSTSGIVHIFNGNEQGISPEPSQSLTSSMMLQRHGVMMRGLGSSGAGGTDMDGNGLGDVVVGAHLSSHAVLLRFVTS